MTRRNEIMEEAEKHMYDWGVDVDRFDVPDIFAKGAEWMQETMIKKATQWLQNTLYEVATGLTNRPDVASIESTTMDDFINNFRKAIEE